MVFMNKWSITLKKIRLFLTYLITLFFLTPSIFAQSNSAPDSTKMGSHKVASAEYRFPASIDPLVLSDTKTEVWGKVFYPTDIVNAATKAPLIVLLHGNHATCGAGANPRMDTSCEYTYEGTCPVGYIPVPNHEGYDYLAKNLASWGYIVTSINANRGITCGGGNQGDWGLNLARGRLVLKHLSLFYQWSTSGGAPLSLGLGQQGLIGKIDFSQVGLMGHSRGGEGVRAAYNLYLDADSEWPKRIPGLGIKAIYEIGAVDGQTSRVLDATGTVWNQLLPMCDGDVSDLEGRFPFERMLLNPKEPSHAQKSLYEVWGANHNFFNTEWQESDSYGCSAGKPIFDIHNSHSDEQQTVALASVPAFFRSHLGKQADPTYNQNFNPSHELPFVVKQTTQVDRDFTSSPGESENMIVDDFDKETGINSSGNLNLSNQIQIENITLSEYQRAAKISWNNSGFETYLETVWAAKGQGRDIHDYATLDFRIKRGRGSSNSSTDFSIALEDATGLLSQSVRVSDYANVNGPGTSNAVLKTVRIPLDAFKGINLQNIHGVRFIFNQSQSGSIALANVRIQRQKGVGSTNANALALKTMRTQIANAHTLHPVEIVPAEMNRIRSVRFMHKTFAISGKPGVEIALASQVPFQVMNRLPLLKVGNKIFKLSRYSDTKALKEITFVLTEKEYQSIAKDKEMSVIDGKIWKFGSISRYMK